MTGFTLGTSGTVGPMPRGRFFRKWPNLSPFAQGYVKAALEGGRPLIPLRGDSQNPFRAPGFSDLAPSTLAAMLKDCEAKARELACPLTEQDGGAYWRKIMSKVRTLYLDDTGKVRMGEATVSQSAGRMKAPRDMADVG